MKTILAVLGLMILLGIKAVPTKAQPNSTDSETMVRQEYSEANRAALGCSNEAWSAILEDKLARVQHRQATTIMSLDLVKSLGDCSLKAQALAADNLTKLLLLLRGGLPAGTPPQGATAVVDVAQVQQLAYSVWVCDEFMYSAESTSETLQRKSLLKEDDSLLHDYLALIDKYNALVSVLNRMPRNFPRTFVIPQPLHCTGYTNGLFTYTTCE
jgi:hypothetical protein